jgi:hypothetical protein
VVDYVGNECIACLGHGATPCPAAQSTEASRKVKCPLKHGASMPLAVVGMCLE